MKMLGRKVRMVPTPPMMPSTMSETTISCAPMEISPLSAVSESHSRPISKSDLIASPTKKVRKNTSAMMPRKMGMPQILCVNALSSLSVKMS